MSIAGGIAHQRGPLCSGLGFRVQDLVQVASTAFKRDKATNKVKDLLARDDCRAARHFNHHPGGQLNRTDHRVDSLFVQPDEMLVHGNRSALDSPMGNLERFWSRCSSGRNPSNRRGIATPADKRINLVSIRTPEGLGIQCDVVVEHKRCLCF